MERICYIIGACEPGDIALERGPGSLVIAADRGLRYLEERGICPDLIVGDFDSLGRVPEGGNVLRHPVEKDDTDMMLAVKTGLERGFRTFVLYGGLGGRLDHTLANLQTLDYLARRGASSWLLGGGTAVTALREGTLRFAAGHTGTISVFCSGEDARGVDLENLYYPLRDAVLTSSFPLGVSNHFTGRPASIRVRSGTLLILWEEPAGEVVRRLSGKE